MPEAQASPTMFSRLKESVVAMRELIIVLVMLILFIQPGWIKSIAQNAGLQSAFGLTFSEEKLKESQEQTKAAQEEVAQIMAQLTRVQNQLERLRASAPATNGELSARITDITNDVGTLQRKSTTVNKSLQDNLKVQESILQVQQFQRR